MKHATKQQGFPSRSTEKLEAIHIQWKFLEMALTSFGDYLRRASVHRITPQHSQECSKLLQIILILEQLFTDNP